MRGVPSADDLEILDPDGQFQARLMADRAALERLADGGQAPELMRLVHGLAGAAGTFGYREIGDAAIALDDALRDGETGPVPALLAALRRALQKV